MRNDPRRLAAMGEARHQLASQHIEHDPVTGTYRMRVLWDGQTPEQREQCMRALMQLCSPASG